MSFCRFVSGLEDMVTTQYSFQNHLPPLVDGFSLAFMTQEVPSCFININFKV